MNKERAAESSFKKAKEKLNDKMKKMGLKPIVIFVSEAGEIDIRKQKIECDFSDMVKYVLGKNLSDKAKIEKGLQEFEDWLKHWEVEETTPEIYLRKKGKSVLISTPPDILTKKSNFSMEQIVSKLSVLGVVESLEEKELLNGYLLKNLFATEKREESYEAHNLMIKIHLLKKGRLLPLRIALSREISEAMKEYVNEIKSVDCGVKLEGWRSKYKKYE